MHVKKGDMVVVLSGDYRGKTGEVLRTFPGKDRVLVEGVNMRWKHKKPSQQSPKGERVQEERAVHSSNVALIDAETGKATRRRKQGEGA